MGMVLLLFVLLAGTHVICSQPIRTTKSNLSFRVEDFGGVHFPRQKRATSLDSSQMSTLLDAHNSLRGTLDPPGANVKFLDWDDNLATMAQDWSDTCNWFHGNHDDISGFSWVGQNLWMAGPYASDATFDLATAVTDWYNEVDYYNYDENTCSSVCGHYTQVVWASSYAVGCGLTHCPAVNQSHFTDSFILTCNYGPGGNLIGERPYATGSPCTLCETGSGECYENKCRPCSEHNEACATTTSPQRETTSANGGSSHQRVTSGIDEEDCEEELSCENGGNFVASNCNCDCTNDYQGDRCQHEKRQAQYGVLLKIAGSITK
uniref:GLIPR1-like protein 1-like n=1 Tax=Saccoglossus kowalevskii TaxID=10224 RepID=A0ABM0MHJ0_SACKO